MSGLAAAPPFGSEFDGFLYAEIREGTNGAPLSVLSALARLDVDPWEEASRLAQLPSEVATLQLITLIAPLCDGYSERPDPKTIVTRLIALLPRRAPAEVPRKALQDVATLHFPRMSLAFLYLLFLVMLLLGQTLLINHKAPSQVDSAPAGNPSTDSPQSATPNVGR